ncbi:MAG: TIM barrel protein [Chloroflexi bacterium]|nr:TIM barrel protein [Chloroflexota bacterium]
MARRAGGLRFGTAGIPLSTRKSSYVAGVERIRELGLGCLELEFVYGVRVNRVAAGTIKDAALRHDIKLSAHAPYWINLNSRDPEKVVASRQRIVQSAQIGALCGARSVVFHPAFYMADPPEKVFQTVKDNLVETVGELGQGTLEVVLRPELSGKAAAFGSLDEIVELSTQVARVAPCIDFAHCHARAGNFNSYNEFTGVLKKVSRRLGPQSLEEVHVHISGIAYGRAGEIKHINLKESDLNYQELLHALVDQHCSGLVICESPNLEEDALLLQETYHKF